MKHKNIFRKTIVIGIISLFFSGSIITIMGSGFSTSNIKQNHKKINTYCSTLAINPTDDATIMQSQPNDWFGYSEYTNVRNDEGSGQAYWALTKFDISSISANAIILSATVNCYYNEWHGLDNPVGDMLKIFRLTSDWNEDTVTWKTKPSNVPQSTSYAIVPASPGFWMQWDVTNDVKAFVTGEKNNFGWKISDETYHGWASIIRLCSRDYSSINNYYCPYLHVEVLKPRLALLFGRVENINTEGDLITFEAVKLRYLQFSPFSFNTYTDGEEIIVVGSGMGIISTKFVVGLYSAGLP